MTVYFLLPVLFYSVALFGLVNLRYLIFCVALCAVGGKGLVGAVMRFGGHRLML